MKTLVFDTAVAPSELTPKRVFYVEGREVRSKIVLVSQPKMLAAMLTEFDDGAQEEDIREAVQAAALADDWTLAFEIATRYGLAMCLRCGTDVAARPTWRLHRLGVRGNWGEICGSCAVIMRERAQ